MGLGKGNTGSVVRNHAESCGPAGLAQCYSPVCVKVTNRVLFLCPFSRDNNKPRSVVIKSQGWGQPRMD